MGTVRVEFTGDEAKLIRSQARLEAKAQKLEAQLKKVGKAGRKAGDDTAKSMKRAGDVGFGGAQRCLGRDYIV